MNRRAFIGSVAGGLLAAPLAAEAQPAKIPRVGFLIAASPSAVAARDRAFREALRQLGYEEGKNIVIDWRYAEGRADRLPAFAAELVRLRVNLILTAGPTSTRAAKEATATIPIVMAQGSDPVGNGFVASLARPGGNITGLATLAPEISGKQLEVLKEMVSGLSHVTALGTLAQPGNAEVLREVQVAAGELRIELRYLDVPGPENIEGVFEEASTGRVGALLVLPSPVLSSRRRQVAELAVRHRKPAMYWQREYVEAGGLICYAPDIIELYRRAAVYVDKILKGAKPADLPVEQPTKFELVINLKTAKVLGLMIPPSVLQRADQVIE